MTKVLFETNISDLLRVSAGESGTLHRLTEDFERKVDEQFTHAKTAEDLKPRGEHPEELSSAAVVGYSNNANPK